MRQGIQNGRIGKRVSAGYMDGAGKENVCSNRIKIWGTICALLAVCLMGPEICGGCTTVNASARGILSGFDGWVQDDAHLLAAGEESTLERDCAQIFELHGTGVYVVTTPDFGGGDIKNWQRQIFEEYGLGADCGGNAVMLAVSMAERDWGLVAFGTAQEAFSTYGRERIGEIILGDLSDGDYDGAFSRYVSMAEEYLTAAEKGKPYTEGHRYGEGWRIPVIIGVSFLASLLASLAAVLSWKKSMNTRVPQNGAMEYLKQGSFSLVNRSDLFLYHTVSRTKRQTESLSDSGGRMHSDHSGTSGKF